MTPQDEEYRSYWAIKILSKNFTAPLTITLNAVDVQIQPIPFTFDAGAAPQAGQSWEVNQSLQILDSPIQIQKASLLTSSDVGLYFMVDVQVDPTTIGDVYISTPLSQCKGGGSTYPTEHLSLIQVYMPMCRPDLPPGMVKMEVHGAVLWVQWQLTWQP